MRKNRQSEKKYSGKRIAFIIIASSGALMTLLPSFLNWLNYISPGPVEGMMLTGTIFWFASATYLSSFEK
jgi:hypothetical protein